MIIYFIGFLTSLISSIFTEIYVIKHKKERNKKNLFFILLFGFLTVFPLTFISMIRYGVGTDYFFTYIPMLNDAVIGGQLLNTEFFIAQLMYFIREFNLPYQFFFATTSIFISVCIFTSIFVQKKNFYVGVSIYFLSCTYMCSLSNIRQFCSIALALLCYSIALRSTNRVTKIHMFVLLFLTILFHKSGIIYIAIYPFIFVKRNKKTILYSSVVLLLISPLLIYGFKFIALQTKYAYLFSFAENQIYSKIFFFVIIDAFIYCLCLYKLKYKINNYIFLLTTIKTIQIAVFASNLIYQQVELYLRMYHIFFSFDIILLPVFVTYFKNDELENKTQSIINYDYRISSPVSLIEKKESLIIISIIVIYFIIFFVQVIIDNMYEITPYRTIFNKDFYIY